MLGCVCNAVALHGGRLVFHFAVGNNRMRLL